MADDQKQKSTLDQVEQIAKIGSLALIPVIIAILGGIIQSSIEANKFANEDKRIKLEYLKLAKDILTDDKRSTDPRLVEWAWELINDAAPVKIKAKVLDAFKKEGVPLPIPGNPKTDLEARRDYVQTFRNAQISAAHSTRVNYYVGKIVAAKARYRAIEQTTSVPWFIIGILHGLETSFNFASHLDGSALTDRSKHFPKDRPVAGKPPFTWEESVADHLRFTGLDKVETWDLAAILFHLERYNGFRMRQHGVRTPYLWACTDAYTRGKFVSDNVFDPNALSKQCGAAAVLKRLMDANEIVVAVD